MYTLHTDTEAFRTLITQISNEQGILPEIIEKDYFVTLMLQEINEKQNHYEVFFKGGTALYKALKSINRFSEDIDLTFNDRNFESQTAKKNALKRVTSEYTSLVINPEDNESVSGSGSRTSVYTYSTLFVIDTFKDDKLSRIGKLKVETTSFTTSSTIAAYEIEPVVYTYASQEYKQLLNENYDVKPFMINCISIERIFIDKLFAIEDYYLGVQANRLIEMSKHMYDIYQLYSLPKIKELIQSPNRLSEVINIKEEEQLRRKEAKTYGKKITQFEYFDSICDSEIRENFEIMQQIYIFKNEFRIKFDSVVMAFNDIMDELSRDFTNE